MKLLNGLELAGFIKERQAKQVRGLRQAHGVIPKLAIITTVDSPVIDSYIRMKKEYAEDMLVVVEVYKLDLKDLPYKLEELNKAEDVHGIIIQLPLSDIAKTDQMLALITPHKDVDGLGPDAEYDSATAMAILWLLSGYNIDLRGQEVLLVGRGRLVGAPLGRMLESSGYDVNTVEESTENLSEKLLSADVIVTATGQPGLILPEMIKPGAVVVDAGTASEGGKIVGDLDPRVYDRDDLTLTPLKGGVGPLTICALFDNLIRAVSASIKE